MPLSMCFDSSFDCSNLKFVSSLTDHSTPTRVYYPKINAKKRNNDLLIILRKFSLGMYYVGSQAKLHQLILAT